MRCGIRPLQVPVVLARVLIPVQPSTPPDGGVIHFLNSRFGFRRSGNMIHEIYDGPLFFVILLWSGLFLSIAPSENHAQNS
jgi:hypothetical protein